MITCLLVIIWSLNVHFHVFSNPIKDLLHPMKGLDFFRKTLHFLLLPVVSLPRTKSCEALFRLGGHLFFGLLFEFFHPVCRGILFWAFFLLFLGDLPTLLLPFYSHLLRILNSIAEAYYLSLCSTFSSPQRVRITFLRVFSSIFSLCFHCLKVHVSIP